MNDNEYWKREEAQTMELVKSLPSNFKESALQHVRAYLELLSPEDKTAWGNFVGKDPILRRVIYYVFSPEEETIGRFAMILTMGGENFVRDMEYVYFALEQPEIRNSNALRSFLKQMKDDWLRILAADTTRLEGSEEDIMELRSKAIIREDGKLTLNHSGSRMEITRNRMNVYVHEDRTDKAHFFTVDDILIRQIQEYQCSELRNETFTDHFKVFVYNRNGHLLPPPRGHRNPFEFSLLERYQGMIRKEGTRHSNLIWGSTVASEGIPGERNKELESIFYEAVLTTKSAKPSYIRKVFRGKVNDLYDERSMVLEEAEIDEIDGNLKRTIKPKRRPFQEREDSIDDILSEPSEDLEAEDRTPAFLSKIPPTVELPETPVDVMIARENEDLGQSIRDLIRQDERLVSILSLEPPRSKKDQKYVERKTAELRKEFGHLIEK